MSCCGQPGSFICTDSWDQIDYATELELNSKLWLDHNFLQIGAWEDVETGELHCGEDFYTLMPIDSPVDTGSTYFWATKKQGLIWESVTHDTGTTLPVTIYHDGVDVTNTFTINYNKGVFFTSTEYTGDLTASYSYRNVVTYVGVATNWWTEIISNKHDLNEEVIWGVLKRHGVVLPSIVIKTSSYVKLSPIQLGSVCHFVDRVVDFTVFSKDPITHNKITAILSNQKDNNFRFIDSNIAEFPINCNGDLRNNNTYEDLVTGYPWKCADIINTSMAHIDSPCSNLYISKVAMTFRIKNPVKNR